MEYFGDGDEMGQTGASCSPHNKMTKNTEDDTFIKAAQMSRKLPSPERKNREILCLTS